MVEQTASDRLRVLVDAGIALSSELSLDVLLQRTVDTSAELTGARYVALGVIDPSGQSLERFLTSGVDDETHAAIGELPRGRGILGVLIRDAKPLRLHDLTEDPRSVGFPRIARRLQDRIELLAQQRLDGRSYPPTQLLLQWIARVT